MERTLLPFKPYTNVLPKEIWTYIFKFDDTYQKYFSENVVPYLNQQCQLFQVQTFCYTIPDLGQEENEEKPKLFLLLKEKYAKLFNDLTNPSFCSTIYFNEQHPKDDYLTFFRIEKIVRLPPSSSLIYLFTEPLTWKTFCQLDD
jgi:hypothetical protein